MTVLIRSKVAWSGSGAVGGGVNTFYFAQATTGFTAAIKGMYSSWVSYFPSSVTWSVPSQGDLIEDSTGDIVGTWNDGTAGTFTGSGSTASWAAGVGARAVWVTGGRRNNRIVRGSTYLVPLMVGAYDTDGTLTTTYLSGLNNAAQSFFTATNPNMRIWSRPHPGTSDGTSHTVTGCGIVDKVSVLRSRRT